jgi:hypothetical protein
VCHATYHLYARGRDIAELVGVVGWGINGLRQVLAHLVLVDIDGGYEIDIADVIAAKVDMHQAGYELIFLGILVIMHPLYKGGCAVPNTNNCYIYFSHFGQLLYEKCEA